MKINELQRIQSELYEMQNNEIGKGNYIKSKKIGESRIAIRDIIIELFYSQS